MMMVAMGQRGHLKRQNSGWQSGVSITNILKSYSTVRESLHWTREGTLSQKRRLRGLD
jgi:hypothetical protein